MLHLSCSLGNTAIVTDVLDLIAEHYSPDQIGRMKTDAVYETARNGTSNIMQLFLDGITLTEKILRKAFRTTCISRNGESLLPLLDYRGEGGLSTEDLREGLIISAGQGCASVVRLLHGRLEGTDSLQTTLDTALNIASLNGHLETVSFLLSVSADPNAICQEAQEPKINDEDQNEPSEQDIADDSGEYIPRYRPPRPSKSRPKRTSLQAALYGCYTPRSHDYMVFVSSTLSIWHRAKVAERENVVVLLLESGADPNLAFESQSSLLTIAVKYLSGRVVRSMLDHGASPVNANEPFSQSQTGIESDSVELEQDVAVASSRSSSSSKASETTRSTSSLLEIAAGRELGSADVVAALLRSELDSTNGPANATVALFAALRFFSGTFIKERPLEAVFEDGPGGVVKLLLPRLPHVRTEDHFFGQLLQMTIAVHEVELVKVLIERGINVNQKGYYYGTALQCAARFGHFDIVQILLRFGANVNAIGGAHDTALRAAVVASNEEIVDTLIAAGAKVDLMRAQDGRQDFRNRGSILHLALRAQNHAIIRKLLSAGANVNFNMEDALSVLTLAVEGGNESIVRLMLEKGAVVNASRKARYYYPYTQDEGSSALHMACAKGYEGIAQLLIDHGANVNLEVRQTQEGAASKQYTTRTPLQVAAFYGLPQIVRLLILCGADIDHFNDHGSALSIAASGDNVEVVEELLAFGASIKPQSPSSNALAAACKSRSHQVVELLLEELSGTPHAEASFADALKSAAFSEDDKTFKLLLDHGAPASTAALSQACEASLGSSVLALLERGVDVDGELVDGGHPIHLAAFQQRYAVVDLLLSRGANAEIETTKYGTPLQALTEGFARVPVGSRYSLGLPSEHRGNQQRKIERRTRSSSSSTKTSVSIVTESVVSYIYDPFPKTKPIIDLKECERVALSLIEHQKIMQATERSFGSPLHVAAYVGSASIVEALLKSGFDANSASERFGNAVFAALEGDSDTVLGTLLSHGADSNYSSSEHGSPLHYACKKHRANAVQILLQHGADVNARNDRQGTPFMAAISSEDSYVSADQDPQMLVRLLLQQSQFRVQDVDLTSAASARSAVVKTCLPLLLEHESAPKTTEAVFLSALGEFTSKDALEILFKHDGSLGVTPAMILAVEDAYVLKFLLEQQPICPITPDIIRSAGRKTWIQARMSKKRLAESDEDDSVEQNRKILEMLIDHQQDLPVTEELMIIVLASSYDSHTSPASWWDQHKIIERLFERNPDLEVTQAMLEMSHRADDLKVLLKRAKGVPISPKVLKAVSKEFEVAQEVVPLLLEYDHNVQVPQEVLDSAYDINPHQVVQFMTVVLDRTPSLKISTELLEKIVDEPYYRPPAYDIQPKLAELFLRHEKRVLFTDELREAIDERLKDYPAIRELFYKLEDTSLVPIVDDAQLETV